MKKFSPRKTICLCIVFVLSLLQLHAQSPGTIVKPNNGGVTILNPNGDKYSSKTTAGYTTNDITQSEVPFKVVPPMISEGGTDNLTGPNGGFTDIVNAVDSSGFYAYFDGTNVLFRLRMGGTNNGSKAYSVLLDTDMKFGNTGQYADSNYVAAGVGGACGNPGFEYEIYFGTHSNIVVYNIDGRTSGVVVATYSLNTHSQISVALSKFSNDADYFYDWGVPATAIGSPALIRFVASSQISPHPALNCHISDMYGINDATITSNSDAWTQIINAQCGFALGDLASVAALCATCTKAPTINPVTTTGTNVAITGNWVSLHPTKPNTALISLYRNGTLVGTTMATSNMGWSITVSNVYSNDVFTAKAKATDESECLASPPILSGCTTPPSLPLITCAGRKGIEGTIPLGAEVIIYEVTATTRSLLTAGLIYTNNATDRKFDFHGTVGQTGAACQGNVNDVADGTYEIITNVNGCYSKPTFICISGNNFSSLTSNAITLSTPILNTHKSVSGTGATAGQTLRLYRNGGLISSITATASAFTFNNLTLFLGDSLRVYAQANVASACMTVSNAFVVTCFTSAPAINSNGQGQVLSSSTSISGTGPNEGAIVNLYKGLPGSGVLAGSTTVAANKTWSVGGLTLIPGDTYYATCTMVCESAASRVVVVKGPTTVCPTITGTYNEMSTTVSGTMPSSFSGKIRLYLDGALIDSTTISSATNWTISVNNSIWNKLYAYGVLRATAEGTNLAEGPICSSVTVQCVSPALPNVSPTSVTIYTGQSASFTVSNAVDTLLYSIWDTFGNNYASSKFGTGAASLTVPSYTFNAAGVYNLMIIADKLAGSGCYSSRSVTVTVQNVTLSTRFVTIAANKIAGQNKVSWFVSSEQNISHYLVERSLDGFGFQKIGSVGFATGATAGNYAFADNNITTLATVYYRIIAVDITGNAKYSPVVTIRNENKTMVQVSPNPASKQANLQINSTEIQMALIELVDMEGRLKTVKKVQLYEGQNMVSLEGLDQYAAGNYILRISLNREQQNIKLVLQ